METQWLSTKEIAKTLKVSESTIYKMVARSKIPFRKVGRLNKFDLEEVKRSFFKGRVRKHIPQLTIDVTSEGLD